MEKEIMSNIENAFKMAEFYMSSQNYSSAIEKYKETIKYIDQIHDYKGKGMLLNKLSFVYFSQGNINDALKVLEESAQSFKQGNFLNEQARTYEDMGIVCSNKGDNTEALKYYTKAYEIYNNLGLGKSEEAVKIQGKILFIKMQTGNLNFSEDWKKMNK